MLTLGLCSSTAKVSVAVAQGAEVLAAASSSDDRRHAEDLMPLIIEVLARVDCRGADLERLAVDVGPGRFTGLRVGVATIRALAVGLGLEVVPASSLELLAQAEIDRPLAAIIDARRGEVFQQVYGAGDETSPPAVGAPEDLVASIPDGAVVVGDGADRYAELFAGAGFRRLEGREPSAATLLKLAADRPARPGTAITPAYLRDPDVQINIRTRP